VIHVQEKTKGLLLKNIVRTVKKSYAQDALNGICGDKTYGYPRDKFYSIQHRVDYRNNQSGCLRVFHSS
jgi:hypothetical protein